MMRGVLLALLLAVSALVVTGGAADAQRFIQVAPDDGPPTPGGVGSFFDFLFGRHPREAPPAPRRATPRPPQARAPSARGPAIRRRPPPPSVFVAVFGDRFADELALGLSDALADRPDLGIVAEVKPDAGFLDKDADWLALAREVHSRSKKVSAVVVMLGPGDAARTASQRPPPVPAAGEDEAAPPAPTRSPWVDLYAAKVDELILALGQDRTPVIWVGLPPVEDAGLSADHAFLNELVRQRVAALGGIFVDPWDGFVDSAGNYAERGPDIDGRTQRLRSTDGIHFSEAGALKLAQQVATALRPLLGQQQEDSDSAAAAAAAAAPHLPGASRIVLLGAPPRSPGAVLLPPAPVQPAPGPDAALSERAMAEGLPVPAQKGRADDFAWPPDGD